MNKHLLHGLAILALALFAGKCELLTAQSGEIKRDGSELRGLHHGLAFANSPADSRQIPESHADPLAIGLAKTKIYEFRSIDYPGTSLSEIYDFNGKIAVGVSSIETAFTFHSNTYQLLNVPGAIRSLASGINASGDIVGSYTDSRDQGGCPLIRRK